MKYVFFLAFFVAISLFSCKNSEDRAAASGKPDRKVPVEMGDENGSGTDSSQLTSVQWLDSLVDFGTVKDGQVAEIMFRFKNTGEKNLIIHNVVAGCGCTVPEYTKQAVAPGKEGFVKAVFNSAGQPPTVHKSVSVAMNTKQQSYTLSFIGEVTK